MDLSALIDSLDRCQHGRHEVDPCVSCPGGRSTGNPLLPHGEVVGYTVHGIPISVPDKGACYQDPDSWLPGEDRPVQREHETGSRECWCGPEVIEGQGDGYVVVHQVDEPSDTQLSPTSDRE